MRIGRALFNFCLRHKPSVTLFNYPKPVYASIRKMSLTRIGDREEDRIVWMDLEMTGLDPDKDHILELACAVTDSNLKLIDQYEVIIHQSDEVLKNMNDWCQDHHSKSGLVTAVRESKISLKEAESQTLSFLKEYILPQTSPLAGNSVHMDKFFMMKQMPEIINYLHYRIIDVSSVKELAKRWHPDVLKDAEAKKKGGHRATDDILESIAELQVYRDKFLHIPKHLHI